MSLEGFHFSKVFGTVERLARTDCCLQPSSVQIEKMLPTKNHSHHLSEELEILKTKLRAIIKGPGEVRSIRGQWICVDVSRLISLRFTYIRVSLDT